MNRMQGSYTIVLEAKSAEGGAEGSGDRLFCVEIDFHVHWWRGAAPESSSA